jgi:putative ABC transport system permease protein
MRYALRVLKRSPAFAAVAVLSLALGIGANAAIFSVINAALLRPLPVREPESLIRVIRWHDDRPGSISYPLFARLRDRLTSISGSLAVMSAEEPIAINGNEDMESAELVSGGYFGVLGVRAAAGRLLDAADDADAPAAPAAVISDAYWQRQFGRSASAIGRSFTILGRPFTIVGVAPPAFRSAIVGRHPDVFLPLQTMFKGEQRQSADFNSLSMLARLKPGATVERANAEVEVVYRAFVQSQAADAPMKDRAAILGQRATAVHAPSGVTGLVDEYGRSLAILMGIVTLVLLLACVNLSGLLLARAASRQREIAIRLAIGAGRGRLVGQFLAESLVLAVAGGALGLAIATACSGRLLALLAGSRDLAISVTPDWRVLAFTGALSLLACAVTALAPAVQAARGTINPALKEAGSRGPRRVGHALVAAQLAISMVLVVGAALFIGTLVTLNRVDRGFDAGRILVVTVRNLRPSSDPAWKTVEAALIERLGALPGVSSSSAVQRLPLTGDLWERTVQIDGARIPAGERPSVAFNVIGPRFFATMGTPLVAGREFDARDTGTSPTVAIVNERFARRFFGGQPAAGGHVTVSGVSYEIVGVAGDARGRTLRDDPASTMYVALAQRQFDQPSGYSYLLRARAANPERLALAIDRLVRDVHPALRLRRARAYTAVIDDSIDTERTLAALGGFFGVLALVVAGLGVFGLLAFQVARRTKELGIRLALGARRGAVIALVLREVAVLALAGVSIGAVAAAAATGIARNLLFGVTPTDPWVFTAAALALSATALVAGWLPARAASRVDPLVALRHD